MMRSQYVTEPDSLLLRTYGEADRIMLSERTSYLNLIGIVGRLWNNSKLKLLGV